jgi:hypothetical protein
VDWRGGDVNILCQLPQQLLRLRVSVPERALVECHVHAVECPEALSTDERVASCVDKHEDDLLTDAEGQDRCQQATSQQLLVAVVASASAQVYHSCTQLCKHSSTCLQKSSVTMKTMTGTIWWFSKLSSMFMCSFIV